MKEIYKGYLLEEGIAEEDILILELDDDRNIAYRDPIVLGDYVRQYCAEKKKSYVFLDEIQKVYTIINPNLTEEKHVITGKEDKEVITFVDVVLGLSREDNIDQL